MILTAGDITGICIAIAGACFVMVVALYANIRLLDKNRYYQRRIDTMRAICNEQHVKKPF